MDINQDRLWSDIQELGRIGRSPDGGITRLAFTPQDRQAQDWLEARMRDAGLAVREDAAGNLIGELCGSRPEKPCVMCGSHYDTVQGGGQFDGTLGILSALEAVRRIREQGTVTERTIRLAAFKDEEGSRFGYGMVGSKSICGILDPEGLTSVDKDGSPWNRPWLITGAGPASWLPVRWRTWGRIWSFTSSRERCWRTMGRPSAL